MLPVQPGWNLGEPRREHLLYNLLRTSPRIFTENRVAEPRQNPHGEAALSRTIPHLQTRAEHVSTAGSVECCPRVSPSFLDGRWHTTGQHQSSRVLSLPRISFLKDTAHTQGVKTKLDQTGNGLAHYPSPVFLSIMFRSHYIFTH